MLEVANLGTLTDSCCDRRGPRPGDVVYVPDQSSQTQ